MRKFIIVLLAILSANKLMAQASQNFDGSFCNGITGCWERATTTAGYCNGRPSNPFATSICNSATQNTATPISGTGSLNGTTHFTNADPTCGFDYYLDTIYSTSSGIDGNTISFKIRFSQLVFPASMTFLVEVVSGDFISSHNYTPADQGTTFTVNETISGSNGGGTIMIVIKTIGQFSTGNFDLVYDIDDFNTNAALDQNNPCISPIITLPVKLIKFSAIAVNCNSTFLNWNTASEEYVNHFEVQRSTDGINFATIGIIFAKNNTEGGSYQFPDNNANGNINYYRLLTVDKDKSFQYSNTIRQNGCKNNTIAIYPNPVTDILNISGVKVGNIVQVSNYWGQILITKTITQNNEIINVANLPGSVYIVSIINAETGKKINSKFSKQ